MRSLSSFLWRCLRDQGDVLLFVAGLFAKSIGFGVQTGMNVGGWVPWITLFLLAMLAGVHQIGPRPVRRYGLFVLSVALSVLIIADLVQMRFTRDVITLPAVLQANQLLDVSDAVREYMYRVDLLYLADVPLWLAYLFASRRRRSVAAPAATGRWIARRMPQIAGLAVSLVLFLVCYSSAKARNDESFSTAFSSRRQVETLGILGFHAHDVYVTLKEKLWPPVLDEDETESIYRWYRTRPDSGREYAPYGVAKNKNVVFLQVEALQECVIGRKINGQEITPNLNRLRGESVYFDRCFDQTHNGRSSDCDFQAFASLHPVPGAGAVAMQYVRNDFGGLPRLLHDRGYSTLAASAFWEDFWNMTRMHRNYGFRRHLYRADFAGEQHPNIVKYLQIDEPLTRTWLSDRSFLRQFLNEMKELPQPFMAYGITIISHNPFDFVPVREWELELPSQLASNESKAGRYLQHMRWVDKVIGEFFDALKDAGLYDDALIVVLGDHDAGFQDAELIDLGKALDEDWNPYLMDRVPLFFRLPGGRHAAPRSTTCGQMDIAPSLCHLLGIPRDGTFLMGHNLFRDNGNAVVPFRDGSFADQVHYYRSVGQDFESGECFDLATGALLDDPSACRSSYLETVQRLTLSDKVLRHDLLPVLRRRWAEETAR